MFLCAQAWLCSNCWSLVLPLLSFFSLLFYFSFSVLSRVCSGMSDALQVFVTVLILVPVRWTVTWILKSKGYGVRIQPTPAFFFHCAIGVAVFIFVPFSACVGALLSS